MILFISIHSFLTLLLYEPNFHVPHYTLAFSYQLIYIECPFPKAADLLKRATWLETDALLQPLLNTSFKTLNFDRCLPAGGNLGHPDPGCQSQSFRCQRLPIAVRWPAQVEVLLGRATPSRARAVRRAKGGTSAVMRTFRNGRHREGVM